MDLGIALEAALFAGSGAQPDELGYRFKVRGTLLLGGEPEERRAIADLLRRLYGLRSTAAHGGRSPHGDDAAHRDITDGLQLCCRIIEALVARGRHPTGTGSSWDGPTRRTRESAQHPVGSLRRRATSLIFIECSFVIQPGLRSVPTQQLVALATGICRDLGAGCGWIGFGELDPIDGAADRCGLLPVGDSGLRYRRVGVFGRSPGGGVTSMPASSAAVCAPLGSCGAPPTMVGGSARRRRRSRPRSRESSR